MHTDPALFGSLLWIAFAVTAGATLIMAVVVRLFFRRRKSLIDL
jgi:hypothetical protein